MKKPNKDEIDKVIDWCSESEEYGSAIGLDLLEAWLKFNNIYSAGN